ncbi:hypothetical protein [Rubrivivax albus]|nr:hypothetical protein [Rubrivivax albus]
MKPAARLSIWALALAALAAVFLAWRSPHLVVDLAAYVAACF